MAALLTPTDFFSSPSPFLAKYPRQSMESGPIKVGVLGATGTVGQRFITLLDAHPWFILHALGASSRSAGKPYSKAVMWKQIKPIPVSVRDMVVRACKPELFTDCAVVFSGLDADAAGEIGLYYNHHTSLVLCMLSLFIIRGCVSRCRPCRVLQRKELPTRSARPPHRPPRKPFPSSCHPPTASPTLSAPETRLHRH